MGRHTTGRPACVHGTFMTGLPVEANPLGASPGAAGARKASAFMSASRSSSFLRRLAHDARPASMTPLPRVCPNSINSRVFGRYNGPKSASHARCICASSAAASCWWRSRMPCQSSKTGMVLMRTPDRRARRLQYWSKALRMPGSTSSIYAPSGTINRAEALRPPAGASQKSDRVVAASCDVAQKNPA